MDGSVAVTSKFVKFRRPLWYCPPRPSIPDIGNPIVPTLCRDCATDIEFQAPGTTCPNCGSTRLLTDPELHSLAIAHIDCDAFYATVEKRDDPDLQGKPVIVGGGQRGVVSACCYIARIKGVHSAMPMFEARKRCPDAVVIRPDMGKYGIVGRQVRALMLETTPLVEPLSIDEAFLDLSGTEALHGGSPAKTLIKLVKRIEDEIGVTASVGLSFNKFLAKIASDLDKPRGFSVLGKAGADAFLEDRPVGLLWGVGKALQGKLKRDGIATIGQLRAFGEEQLVRSYGSIGHRLYHFSRGQDERRVTPDSPAKSISSETTFNRDIADGAELRRILWRLAEKVSRRLKTAGLAAGNVTLKMKQADFRQFTRTRQLPFPTQLAEELFRGAEPLLAAETDGRRYRLIGIGGGKLGPAGAADEADLLDPEREERARVERALDAVREKYGNAAIVKGRAIDPG